MKFTDIPQMTCAGNYQVNVDLAYLKDFIHRQCGEEELGKNAALDLNPDFQRGYVWTEDQQIKFVEYLLRGGKTTPIYFNCKGWMRNFEGPFVIVDGKQRLNACMRFINNEIKAYSHYLNEYEDGLRMSRANLVININDLKTRKEVLNWYLELNTGGTVHTNDEIEKVKKLIELEE